MFPIFGRYQILINKVKAWARIFEIEFEIFCQKKFGILSIPEQVYCLKS